MIARILAKYLCFKILKIENMIIIRLIILKKYKSKVNQKYLMQLN